MRMMALKDLYKAANSKLVGNGVDMSAMANVAVELVQAEAATVAAPLSAEALNGGEIEYVLEGALPAGLTLDPYTGIISGLPTEIASSEGTVYAVVDGWIKGSCNYSVTVTSPWSADLPRARVGEAYDGSIASNINATGTLAYSVAGGSLPEGMEIAADTGLLTGAPTTEGTYTFQIAATFTSRQGWRSVSTTYVSEEFTITVRPAN